VVTSLVRNPGTYTPDELLTGVALDLLVGDPHWLPHPVRAIGWWAARLENRLRVLFAGRLAGAFFWLLVVGPVTGVVWFSVAWLPRPWISIYWIYSFLAIRSLDRETTRAIQALATGNLTEARQAVAMVVGRDTADLDEPEVLRAAVETLAENLSDGVVAPLFYLALGGPAAMAAYKTINTLDNLVGYKDDRYRDFGWFAARADDWANFIPARLTALFISLCALLPRLRFRNSVFIAWRDANSQPSPNSGWPEAAMAGALGVRLGGVNRYQGRESIKAFLGDVLEPLSLDVYRKARVVLYGVAGISVALTWSFCR
jgi:adenosylcobinamide-phosphate synthase